MLGEPEMGIQAASQNLSVAVSEVNVGKAPIVANHGE